MERKIIIHNSKLRELLKRQNDLNTKVIAWNRKAEDCERERNKIAIQLQKVKETAQPMIAEAITGKLTEFEYVSLIKLENGVPMVNVVDAIEEFKKSYSERKHASNKA